MMIPTSSEGADSWGLGKRSRGGKGCLDKSGQLGGKPRRMRRTKQQGWRSRRGVWAWAQAAGLGRDSELGAACPTQGVPRP